MSRRDDPRRSFFDELSALYAEILAFAVFTILGPAQKSPPPPPRTPPDNVASLSKRRRSADHPLEVPRFMRHLGEHHEEGSAPGWEDDDVSEEFLSQLEQRTQQVKITLANLEAEKVRIEGLIAQLQPIVPHYDALVAAERQLAQADVRLDATSAATQDAAPGDEQLGGTQADDSEGSGGGWSGSWNN